MVYERILAIDLVLGGFEISLNFEHDDIMNGFIAKNITQLSEFLKTK